MLAMRAAGAADTVPGEDVMSNIKIPSPLKKLFRWLTLMNSSVQ